MELNPDGWCCLAAHGCLGIGVPTVRGPGVPELCVPCLCRDLGLPEGTPAEDVVAEVLRRHSEVTP